MAYAPAMSIQRAPLSGKSSALSATNRALATASALSRRRASAMSEKGNADSLDEVMVFIVEPSSPAEHMEINPRLGGSGFRPALEAGLHQSTPWKQAGQLRPAGFIPGLLPALRPRPLALLTRPYPAKTTDYRLSPKNRILCRRPRSRREFPAASTSHNACRAPQTNGLPARVPAGHPPPKPAGRPQRGSHRHWRMAAVSC
jgi:hypothetical protein